MLVLMSALKYPLRKWRERLHFASDFTGLKHLPKTWPDSMALHHLVMNSELVASSRRSLNWGAARKTESDKTREKRTAPHLTEHLEDATELIKHL